MADSAAGYPANAQIPVDLFVSKKHPGLTRGDLGFADASGNIVFKVDRKSSKSSADKRVLLLDSEGNPLISMHRHHDGSWEGFKGDKDEKDLIFRVRRKGKTEFEVFLDDSASELKLKGSAFQKSCTIYKGNAIIAQTSLMYKLRQLFVRRDKFRLTIFPGFVDHALVAALIVIFHGG
ncbi:protein LURP-one-related 7 [Alnus glutinosa]|uniref:protein LURP-one-related 7 n=1 Tax=Alnus glutinosa TaxID=3517 RepID=UPI002D79F30B|nr:protein LURP-one-related 7 [Alnus glutinosa]